MSIVTDDPPGLAGAGHLMQHLHFPHLQNQIQLVGGHVRIDRSSDAIVYTVTGPASELHFLADLLRSALEAPTAGPGALLTAHRDLAEERLAEWETAGEHLRSALRTRIFPMDLSAAGSEGSARRIEREPIDRIWARMYRPERVSILAVGDVRIADVQREFGELPPPAEVTLTRQLADTVTLVPLAPAEATRGWFGVGYRASGLDPAAVSVTSRLLGDVLRERLPDSEVLSEHWWTHYGQAIALMMAVPPTRLTSTPALLLRLPADLLDALSDARVADGARALRHDLLFYSRTPDRMAEVLGQFIDRGGDADSAQEFYRQLGEVSTDDIRTVLRHLIDSDALRVEIPPQKLGTTP